VCITNFSASGYAKWNSIFGPANVFVAWNSSFVKEVMGSENFYNYFGNYNALIIKVSLDNYNQTLSEIRKFLVENYYAHLLATNG